MKNLITSRLTAFLCATVMVLGLTACGAKITGLSLPAGTVLEKGETLQMDLQYDTETQADADALAEAAEKLELVWTSDDETVAVVDENGKVTAKKAGSAVITASCGEVSAQYKLTVQNVKCSYCGKTGHISSNCPTKAADEAAAAAAAQAAAEQAAQQQAATSGDSSTPSNDPPVGSSGFDDQYGSWFVTESHDWTQDPSNMSNGQAGVKGDWDAGFGMSSGTDWTENDAGSGGVVR